MKEMFKGIIPPLITPLKAPNKLDVKGLEKIVEHILSGGVHGLFILGTTGEGPNLSYELRFELTKRVCSQVDGRVPVLVGITDTSLSESLQVAKKATAFGAEAVVAAPPYYFTANQSELTLYFQLLAEESPLPLFLYNMPSHTKVHFEPETVRTLAEHSNIVGFKDSSADIIYFQKVVQLLKDNPDFSLFVGPEEMLMQSILSGAHGGVNGGANMFPKLYVAMYDAVKARDFERMQKLQEKILEISSKLYSIGNSSMKYLQGVKCALSMMGICNDTLALPFHAFDKAEKENVQQVLQNLNVEEILE